MSFRRVSSRTSPADFIRSKICCQPEPPAFIPAIWSGVSVVGATARPLVAGACCALTKALTIRCWRGDSLVYAPTTGSVVGRVVLAAVTAAASTRSTAPLIRVDRLGRVARARSAERLCKPLVAEPDGRRPSGSRRRAESGEVVRLVMRSIVQRFLMPAIRGEGQLAYQSANLLIFRAI